MIDFGTANGRSPFPVPNQYQSSIETTEREPLSLSSHQKFQFGSQPARQQNIESARIIDTAFYSFDKISV